jgi:hypothetical protein
VSYLIVRGVKVIIKVLMLKIGTYNMKMIPNNIQYGKLGQILALVMKINKEQDGFNKIQKQK